jgi:hypothetical protein
MSSDDRPLTERDIEPLLQALGRFFDESSPAIQALFDQTRANSLVCAFLLREMKMAGLVDAEAIEQEALAIADSYDPPGSGAGVAGFIKSIFGGQPPDIPPQMVLRVIQGGLERAGSQGTAQPGWKPANPQGADDQRN